MYSGKQKPPYKACLNKAELSPQVELQVSRRAGTSETPLSAQDPAMGSYLVQLYSLRDLHYFGLF